MTMPFTMTHNVPLSGWHGTTGVGINGEDVFHDNREGITENDVGESMRHR